MKHSKLFAVLSLLFLISSCSKDSNSVEPAAPAPPSIIGTWNFVSQSDTLLHGSQPLDTTWRASTDLYGSINFQSDSTVYRTTSFTSGVAVFGADLYFYGQALIMTDTSKYAINNNVISFTGGKYNSPYKNTIITLDKNNLVLSDSISSVYKKTYYYSR